MKSKAQYRQDCHAEFVIKNSGKLAQRIRGLNLYHEYRQLFVSPSPFLSQVRINALLDGKDLVMPSPGLKQGFFVVKPFSVPFPKLSFAVSLSGISQYGTRISSADIASCEVGLLISEALIVDMKGTRIGDGTGYFDLAVAILQEYGGIAQKSQVLAVLADGAYLVEGDLPMDPWDVPVEGVVTHNDYCELRKAELSPAKVYWEELPHKTIKRIDPLWKLYCKNHPNHTLS